MHASLSTVFALATLLIALPLRAAVTINEIMSANDSAITDEDGDHSDWIELHNSGTTAVDLSGWGLSDNAADPMKWTFPVGTSIGAGHYLLVWASGKDRQPDGPATTPSSLAGLVLWLDASQETLGNGAAMAAWTDRSGQGNNVTQATTANRPVFRTGAINGRPAIDFNGSTQDFAVPSQTFNGMPSLANFTLLTVLKWEGKTVSGIWGTSGAGANAGNLHFEIRDATGLIRARHGNLNALQTPAAVSVNAWNVLGLSQKETGEDPGLSFYRNGGQIGFLSGQPGLTTMANYTGMVLGNSFNSGRSFDGLIAEFMLFNYTLADTDRRGVERYLEQKYGLGGELHTNFSLSASGEDILLTRADGGAADLAPPTALRSNVSLGRAEGGEGSWRYFPQSTPGTGNITAAYLGFLDPPAFSQSPGFRTLPHSLALSHPDPQVTLRYTLDGSTPTATSPLYQTPLQLGDRSSEPNVLSLIPTNFVTGARGFQPPRTVTKKANVVRVRAEKPDYLPSELNGTFFIFPLGANQYSVPVFSVITDQANLFDHTTGLFVPGATYTGSDSSGNYYQVGDAWERPANLEFFEDNGDLAFQQKVGVRIHGAFTRRFPQKSLRLYGRSEYGANDIQFPFFPDKDRSGFESLILRASGNDWGFTLFMDAAAQTLVRHFNVDTQAYRPSVVFINGEYWGIHNLRERYDTDYLGDVYGVDEDSLDVLSDLGTVDEGDSVHYTETLAYITGNNLAIEANMDQVRTRVDVDNFIDYYCAQIYYGNDDWPHNNIQFWRLRTPYNPAAPAGKDGRWRWLLFDVDRSLGYLHTAAQDMMAWVTRVDSSTSMFRAFLTNPGFKRDFVNRFADHLNTAFLPTVVTATVDRLKPPVDASIDEHINRWTKPDSRAVWEGYVQGMKTYGNDRPAALRQQLITHLALGPSRQLTVNVSDRTLGSLKVNSLTIDENLIGLPNPAAPYPWTGAYFQGTPVTVTAVAEQGYRFARWTGRAETTPTLTLDLTADTSVTAVFEIDPTRVPSPHVLANGPYTFTQWAAASPAGQYPAHMIFQQTAQPDPALATELESYWTLPYNLTTRSRINGLDTLGLSFINTGAIQDLVGAGYVGSALLGLDTLGRSRVQVTWTGGTILPNERICALRLQYRVGGVGPFTDVLSANNQPVEYLRSTLTNHASVLGPIALPAQTWNQPYVQLRWKYYYQSGASGARPQLRLDDIAVTSTAPGTYEEWAFDYFTDPAERADPLRSGPTADARGDGLANLLRYALDQSIGELPAAVLPALSIDAQRLALTFHRDPAKTDITYVVEATTDLSNWTEVLYDSSTDLRANNLGTALRITDNRLVTSAPRRFLRLKVIRQP